MQDNVQQSATGAPPPPQSASNKKPQGEYIDFEEVK